VNEGGARGQRSGDQLIHISGFIRPIDLEFDRGTLGSRPIGCLLCL